METVQASPSLGNDLLHSTLSPGDSWVSEHIPLTAIPSLLIHTHKCPDATLPPFCPFTGPVSPCPLLPSSSPYLHLTPLFLLFVLKCFLSCIFQRTPRSLTVTLIFLPHLFPDWEEPRGFNSSLNISLFCQIAKLAIVFNHSHNAKSHEVIKNF